MKRYLYLIHRWLGISLCLFMVMWFFSGVVMMYVGYPKLSNLERLAALPRLDHPACCAELDSVLAIRPAPENLRLTTVNGTPRFIAQYGKKDFIAVDGLNGQQITAVSETDAVQSAQSFLNSTGKYISSVSEDPWTHSRALDGFRPLHRVLMRDANNTLLYVAGSTGEVVRDATGTERAWNWLGSWIHWLYPFRGGFFDSQSANIIIYSALACCFLVLTGIAVGIWRWRFKGRYQYGGKTPYRTGMMRWHHLTGLIFGIISFTWIFSGLLSMNPWKVFDAPATLNNKAYTGGVIDKQHFPLSIANALQLFHATGFYPHELEWRLLNQQGYYIAFDNAGNSRILAATSDAKPMTTFDWTQLEQTAQRLMGNAVIQEREILTEYDFYYYQRAPHTMSGHTEHRLPILRLKFNDPNSTWLHLDPYTGTWTKLDARRRTSRWLFNFLHSWDALPLLNLRPLWDGLLILFSIGGFLLSTTGLVIAVKRLKRIKNEATATRLIR